MFNEYSSTLTDDFFDMLDEACGMEGVDLMEFLLGDGQ